MQHDTITPSLFRDFMRGLVDRAALPQFLVRQLETIQRRLLRRQLRAAKRHYKATHHTGKAEQARRCRQIAAGSLRVENGLVT